MSREPAIGVGRPTGPLSRVEYVGPKQELRGKTGLAHFGAGPFAVVQMDDGPYASGWLPMSVKHLKVINRGK